MVWATSFYLDYINQQVLVLFVCEASRGAALKFCSQTDLHFSRVYSCHKPGACPNPWVPSMAVIPTLGLEGCTDDVLWPVGAPRGVHEATWYVLGPYTWVAISWLWSLCVHYIGTWTLWVVLHEMKPHKAMPFKSGTLTLCPKIPRLSNYPEINIVVPIRCISGEDPESSWKFARASGTLGHTLPGRVRMQHSRISGHMFRF